MPLSHPLYPLQLTVSLSSVSLSSKLTEPKNGESQEPQL